MAAVDRWLLWACMLLMVGCSTLPPQTGRVATVHLADTSETTLARTTAAAVAAHPGQTGIHPLPIASEAFAARAVVAAVAQRSLDVQYYIWHGDETGTLLMEALWRAAERGVRVRLLLDDNNTGGLDEALATLDAHPNIEVRLYNPVLYRGARSLNYLTDFSRVNRRMHNKSFTADNQVTIVGGRNVGNEYFGAGTGVEFADLDVAAIGAVVPEVSEAFDLYWNSASAYPAAALVGAPPPDGPARLKARFDAVHAAPDSMGYLRALVGSSFVEDMVNHRLHFEWATARLVRDDPAKTLTPEVTADQLMLPALMRTIGEPRTSFDLVSPYFVPGEKGTEALAALARRGVKVRVLTNSLSSTDVGAVHAGYAKRRKALLAAGVQLYEIKDTAGESAVDPARHSGQSASASLHAKTFAIDGQRIFVGSFNFDPRSALLNTELGLVVDSPTLAQPLGQAFDQRFPLIAYEVRLMPDGDSLEWIERTPQGETRFDTEPRTSALRRFGVSVMSVLPIDWLL